MADHQCVDIDGGLHVRVVFSDADDGDFRIVDPQPGLDRHRRRIVDMPWSWVKQVHGAEIVTVDGPGHNAGSEADGLITTTLGSPIAVTTADCAPVVLVAERGVAVVHAGWRGLVAGIIESAGQRLRTVAGEPVATLLGLCIGPTAYRFERRELDLVIDRLGSSVESTTDRGEPALDVPAAVGAACSAVGWPIPNAPPCTSDVRWYSHRTRADRGRQTAVAWLANRFDVSHDRGIGNG